MAVKATSVTLSFNRKEDAPLFLTAHTVFCGIAPQKYEILGKVEISVFKTAAVIEIIYSKMPDEVVPPLPPVEDFPEGAIFFSEMADPKILTASNVTPEQKASLTKWVKEKNIYQFPEVKEVTYYGGPEKGVVISEADSRQLIKIVQRRAMLLFPSIKPKKAEPEKKTP